MSQSHRWDSSSKPPLRNTESRISSAGRKNQESDARSVSTPSIGGDSKRASRIALHADADSSSESDIESKLTISASKLPPITRSNTLSRSSSKSSSASLHRRKPAAKQKKVEVNNDDIYVTYQSSLPSAEDKSPVDSKDQTPETNKTDEEMTTSNDILSIEGQKKVKKSDTKNNNTKISSKATKPLWGTKPAGKRRSKATKQSLNPDKDDSSVSLKESQAIQDTESVKTEKKKKGRKKASQNDNSASHIPPTLNIPHQTKESSQNRIGPSADRQKTNESADSNESKELSDLNTSRSAFSTSHASDSESSASDSLESSESSKSSSASSVTSDVEESEDVMSLIDKDQDSPCNIITEDSEQPLHLMNSIDNKKVHHAKKRAAKDDSQRINPLTRLNVSQYNLFSNTAGAFHGPGDVYYKFVLGGKSVRPGAKKMKKVKIREVELGKLDEILVEKSKYQATMWNYRSVTKLRERHKEFLNDSITDKVIALEQTRAYIITTINAINSFKKLLEELFNQNEKLRKEYTKVIAGSNKKVSETLAKNEDFVEKILKLGKDKIMERKKAVNEFANYMKVCEQAKKDLEIQLEQKRNALKAKIHDMQDLKEFERASFEDPAITEKRLAREVESKQVRLKALEEELENTKKLEETLKKHGSAIFENALLKFDTYVKNVTQKLKDANFRHKKEIDEQERLCSLLMSEIETLNSKALAMKKEALRQVDGRRNVLQLKDFMTCKPDMEIIIQE